MKLTHHLREYLTFNRQEQRGIFVLLLILSLTILATFLVRRFHSREGFDFSVYEKEIAQFERELRRQDSNEQVEKLTRYKKYQDRFLPVYRDSGKTLPAFKKEILIIELNSADTFELQRLRGIGPSFARRIAWYRERLGGFIDRSQLLEVFGIDEEKFKLIAPNIIVNSDSVHPMDLNTVSFKEMMGHPYFPYGMAKAIMLYRKEHKVFRSVEELRNIPGINDSVMIRIRPYVRASTP